jgi:hypothetical protein
MRKLTQFSTRSPRRFAVNREGRPMSMWILTLSRFLAYLGVLVWGGLSAVALAHSPTPPQTPPPPPVVAPQPLPAPGARLLAISLRYGPAVNNAVVQYSSRDAAGDNRLEQRVLVLEGSKASFSTRSGGSIVNRTPIGGQPAAGAPAEHITQFEVTPQLNGRVAILQVNVERESTGVAGGQRLNSTVSVPLGEWVELGGRGPWMNESVESASSRDARAQSDRVLIRVDEVRR